MKREVGKHLALFRRRRHMVVDFGLMEDLRPMHLILHFLPPHLLPPYLLNFLEVRQTCISSTIYL